MKNGKIGMYLLVLGIVLWFLYGLFEGFNEIISALNLITGFLSALVVLGVIILFISVLIEQQKGKKKMKKEIKKEDLEP
ncbi:MAG: hypothetical protein V5A68_02295 [Candidatus Thermoplasmatota archaeon]